MPQRSSPTFRNRKCLALATQITGQTKWTKQDPQESGITWNSDKFKMGLRYLNRDGVPGDLEKARSWLEKSAAHRDPDAATVLKKLPASAGSTTPTHPAASSFSPRSSVSGTIPAMLLIAFASSYGGPRTVLLPAPEF